MEMEPLIQTQNNYNLQALLSLHKGVHLAFNVNVRNSFLKKIQFINEYSVLRPYIPPLLGLKKKKKAKDNDSHVSVVSTTQRISHAFAWSYISMIADTSHSNHLFPLSKHCCAADR